MAKIYRVEFEEEFIESKESNTERMNEVPRYWSHIEVKDSGALLVHGEVKNEEGIYHDGEEPDVGQKSWHVNPRYWMQTKVVYL